MKLGTVISDFNSIFTGDTENEPPVFLFRLEDGEKMTKVKITAMFTLLSVGVIAVLFSNLFIGSADISVSDAVTAVFEKKIP